MSFFLSHEHVNEGRFAGSGTAHDCREGALFYRARHVLENRLGGPLGLEAQIGVSEGEAELGGICCLSHRIDEGSKFRREALVVLLRV